MAEEKEVKEDRVKKLLRELKVGSDFSDPELPSQYFSHSQYVSWRICGQAYAYRYVDKIRGPPRVAMTQGTSVHKGIEFMLLNKKLGKIPKLDEGKAVVSDLFDHESQGIQDWEETTPGALKDNALKLFEHFAVYALPQINPVAIETGFAKKIGGVPVIGWIDLIDEQPAMIVPGMGREELAMAPTKLVTVDFKTGKAKWSEDELRKDTQLTLYSLVKGTPHVRVDQLLTQGKGPKYIRGDSVRTRQDTALLEEDIHQVSEFIKAGIFPKAGIDSWSCNEKQCPYWSKCRGAKR